MGKLFRDKLAKNNLLQIASCFLIFALLSNLIYIPCYFYIRKINQTNIVDQLQSQLESGMQTINSSVDMLYSLPNIISNNSDYKTTYYKRSDFTDSNLDKLRKTVNDAFLPFGFITEAGLTIGDSLLFTKQRIFFELDQLSHPFYFSCDRAGYLEEFKGTSCILPAARFHSADHGEYDAITVGYCWRKTANMYFFVHYPLNQLFPLFCSNEVLNSNHLAIYSGDILLAEHGQKLAEDYITLSTSTSNRLNLRVEIHLSNSFIQQNLIGMTQLIRLFLIIVAIAALLWILIFSLVLWQPFRHIGNALYNTGYVPKNSAGKNFTETVITGITHLGHQISDYEQIIATQRERNRIHLFEKTLYRGLYGEESRQDFNHLFPDFPPKWQLVMAQYASDDNSIDAEMMQTILTQYLQTHYPNIFSLPQSQDALLILLPVASQEESTTLMDLKSLIEQQHNFYVSFTFSGIYEDPAFLSEAFQDLCHEDFSPSQSTAATISIQQLQSIYYALQSGDAKAAVSSLNSSTAKILLTNDQFSAKHAHRILRYVLTSLKLENACLADIPIPAFRSDDLQSLFEQEFPDCFYLIAAQLKQQHMKQTEQLEQNILSFIQDNLANTQLSVSMVAEHFHISAPTLQKRINAVSGKTFSAYVESVRMQRAQQLLRETSDTVLEIAEAIGYSNKNSFHKAYKRYFGEPPLSYRNRVTGK